MEDSENETTAELPKAALGGGDLKPGDEVTLRIVQVMEDSVLVKYASEGESEEMPPAEAEAPPGAMTSMME